jgi:hypothetical protein
MKNLTRHLWLAAMVLVGVHPAGGAGPDIDMTVDCPPSASAGSTITVDVSLKNRECSPVDVRLMSSIAGNANQSVGGIGIWGPVLADTITVAAATDNLPGTCDLERHRCDATDGSTCAADDDCVDGFCDIRRQCEFFGGTCSSDFDCGSGESCVVTLARCQSTGWFYCETDEACLCQHVTPEIRDDSVLMPPAIPAGLVGTVATLIVLGEGDTGLSTGTDVGQCLVNVLAAP